MNDLTDYEAVMNAVNEDDDSDETVDMSPEELSRLTTNLTYVHPAPPEAPVVMENADGITATWKEPSDDGTYVIEWDLKQKQYEFYKNMKDAGSKQICAFLSGEGGMGKSLIIRLLVRHWRSAGFNVIVCAASAKAATLVNGQTVHSAFKLNKDGKFLISSLEGKQYTPHYLWLASAEVHETHAQTSFQAPKDLPTHP